MKNFQISILADTLYFSRMFAISIVLICCMMTGTAFSQLRETYKFERMWPALRQPWYFTLPRGIAIDQNDFIYVPDGGCRIQKFMTGGQFVAKWGKKGYGDTDFGEGGPVATAIDDNGFVYVNDSYNFCIKKFTSDGQFLLKWGHSGTGDGEFSFLVGITVDHSGFLYVTDRGNHRVQKFTSDGEFVAKWGEYGTGYGQFDEPAGIFADGSGFVYVADTKNRRVQKFASDGQFVAVLGANREFGTKGACPYAISADSKGVIYVIGGEDQCVYKFTPSGEFIEKWGTKGDGDGEFSYALPHPYSIAIDSHDIVYVTDRKPRIQKFTSDGQFLTAWKTYFEMSDGKFSANGPQGLTTDPGGFLYAADTGKNCIQKFTPDGQFVAKWGRYGSGDGEFRGPEDIAADSNGFIYVIDKRNDRIQKFTSAGQFVAKWGSKGSGEGEFVLSTEFSSYSGIAADNEGFVYVADAGNYRIQKFTGDGDFAALWECRDPDDGTVYKPYGIAADTQGFVYVVDQKNDRIYKLTRDGEFVGKWGSPGSGDGQFNVPEQIAADKDDNIYVSDRYDTCIQKFTSDGQFVAKFGGRGSDPGTFYEPTFLCVSPEGKVYVSDFRNHRIQVFRKGLSQAENTKAIIVAGGGPYAGNHLWDATQMVANFAYRAMTYQGFTKETICYLSANTDLDLDGNGEPDDVDGDITNANLRQAITEWAADADSLVIYLTDHGGDQVFRMNGTQILSAADLNEWLNDFQENYSGKIILIYDACESGSFISALTPRPGKERIVIASTSPNEPAYFVSQGSVSFSNYFWSNVFSGLDVRDGFDLAARAMTPPAGFQHPLLDSDSNGLGNEAQDLERVRDVYIGNGIMIPAEAPRMEAVSEAQTVSGNSATIYASGVRDEDGISQVWALIRPPDFNEISAVSPVQELPAVDLLLAGDDRYEREYSGFNTAGTYQISVYATDGIGEMLAPMHTTVTAASPLKRRVILVAGESASDTMAGAIENSASIAYEALRFQGYSQDNDDMYLISPGTIAGISAMPVTPTSDNLQYAVENWAARDTWDLVIYLVGEGRNRGFGINATETVFPEDLDAWIDNLQALIQKEQIPGTVTVICDMSDSGSFIASLPGENRILVSGTSPGQPAIFAAGGTISFSRFFWKQIVNGANVRDAFVWSQQAVKYLGRISGEGQMPMLDDNGNGIGNEKSDGRIARDYTIGVGIVLAGDDPLIGYVSPAQILNGETSAAIWAGDITTTRTIAKVEAVIIPPVCPASPSELAVLELNPAVNGQYEGVYENFSELGIYQILVYATDTKGNISLPAVTHAEQTIPAVPAEETAPAENGDISPPVTETMGDEALGTGAGMSLLLEGSASLTVFDAQNRECGKLKCEIPGASFEITGTGQRISLDALGEGNYRFVVHGAADGSAVLTVTGTQQTIQVLSGETREIAIDAHQVLKSDAAVSALENITEVDFGVFEMTADADGNPLYYDFDGDSDIDDDDIERVYRIWNKCKGDPEYDRAYDLDEDGCIELPDITPVINSKYVP